FVYTGPLTDRLGGRAAMLISLVGACLANAAMGFYLRDVLRSTASASVEGGRRSARDVQFVLTALYAVNMYFQSFGAVAIVKVNSAWFHVRERGGFSGIFGTMISSGLFFAFTINPWILGLVKDRGPMQWVMFAAPAALLAAVAVCASSLYA